MKPARRRGVRPRTCETCGRQELVRADNPATRCSDCARSANGRVAGAKRRGLARDSRASEGRPRITAACPQCGTNFPTSNRAISRAKRHSCSMACKLLYFGVQRICKCCGKQFRALKSRIRGITKSNSSANFCSQACYHRWLCKPDRTTGRGSQWRQSRLQAIARAPFCAKCGTTKRLEVHHIVPFRMTRDNRPVNLIPLCKSCHKQVESILTDVLMTGLPARHVLLAFGSILRDRQIATFAKLRELLRHAKDFRAER